MKTFIQNLPKAELHLHIEGSLEADLMFKLANKNSVSIPYSTIEDLKKAYNFNNLQEFLDLYYLGTKVLITEDDFYQLTYAYLKRAREENVLHSEFFFDPQAHTERGIAFETVFNGIYKATVDAKENLGISSFIIMSFLRHLSQDEALKTLEQSMPFRDKIIGIGLDSSEAGNPPEKFELLYAKARQLGYRLMAHAGEEGPAEYIWTALKNLKIERIDHGNSCLTDQKLIDYIVENKIPLTVCPQSNISLKVVDKYTNHPIKKMLDLGILVTVNSDDPAYFGEYINGNYSKIASALMLNKDDLVQLAINSFTASLLSDSDKNKYINLIKKSSK